MSRIRLERETTITFNEAESEAMVWSASQPVLRRLKKMGFEPYRNDGEGKSFKLPKKLISIRFPRIVSEAAKNAFKERMRIKSKRVLPLQASENFSEPSKSDPVTQNL